MQVALAGVPLPPKVKQHTPPVAQLAALVHERAAPWHWPMAVHVDAPRPVSGAQHTWVAVLQVEVPQATVPPLDPELPLPEPELLLDVDPDPLLLEAEPPLDEDAEPPVPELDADPEPPLDPESSTVASSGAGPTPGIKMMSSRGLREPHPMKSKAVRIASGFVRVMEFPSGTVVLCGVPDRSH
jgi:hypothetical protein